MALHDRRLTLIQKNGFSLIELIIGISIAGILLSSILTVSSRVFSSTQQSLVASELYQAIHLARQTAIARDTDIEVQSNPDSFQITEQTTTIHSLAIPHNTTISQNNKIGFKGNGNTQFSGSVTIQSPNHTNKISIGVGYGRINLK